MKVSSRPLRQQGNSATNEPGGNPARVPESDHFRNLFLARNEREIREPTHRPLELDLSLQGGTMFWSLSAAGLLPQGIVLIDIDPTGSICALEGDCTKDKCVAVDGFESTKVENGTLLVVAGSDAEVLLKKCEVTPESEGCSVDWDDFMRARFGDKAVDEYTGMIGGPLCSELADDPGNDALKAELKSKVLAEAQADCAKNPGGCICAGVPEELTVCKVVLSEIKEVWRGMIRGKLYVRFSYVATITSTWTVEIAGDCIQV